MKEKLLLHSCCAPCACAVITALSLRFDITLFFVDSNIWPQEEYQIRKTELEKISTAQNIPLIIPDYNHSLWEKRVAEGLEEIPEGGLRCLRCYNWRLQRLAREAINKDIKNIATTLSISPHKKADLVNKVLQNVCQQHDLIGIFEDFSSLFSYSCQLSKEKNFYRQKYCGCEFSIKQRIKVNNKS